MALRKSIVFIGAVIVLAACDRATAPTGPLSLHDGPAASAKKAAPAAPASPSKVTTFTSKLDDGACAWVKNGDSDSTLVCD